MLVMAGLASVLVVGFDLNKIASIGSAVALLVFSAVTIAHFRLFRTTGDLVVEQRMKSLRRPIARPEACATGADSETHTIVACVGQCQRDAFHVVRDGLPPNFVAELGQPLGEDTATLVVTRSRGDTVADCQDKSGRAHPGGRLRQLWLLVICLAAPGVPAGRRHSPDLPPDFSSN